MGFLEDHKTLAVATVAATGGALVLWTISSQRRHRRQFLNQPTTTDFDSFLRKPIANPSLQHQQGTNKNKRKYAATSFEAYLTNIGDSPLQTTATATASPTAIDSIPCCPPDSKPVTILYGTEFGFSREIAEKLYQRIKKYSKNNNSYWPELLNLADFPDGFCLEKCQLVLTVCSTQGDGVPPTEVRDFCSWLHGPTAPYLTSTSSPTTTPTRSANHAGVKFSVLALGDRSYTHFARCGKTIDARLEQLGGIRCTPRVDVNKEDFKAVDGWIEAVLSKLDILDLETAEALTWNGVLAYSNSMSDISNGVESKGSAATAGTTPAKWTKSKPYFAAVVGVESLCNLNSPSNGTNTTNGTSTTSTIAALDSSPKNTVRVEIDLGDSGIDYLPGDALGVWPTNDPHDVDDLLEVVGMGGGGSSDEVLVKVPHWHYNDEDISTANNNKKKSGGDGERVSGFMTLREALTRCYDLRSPKPELLQLLATKLADLKEKKENGFSLLKNGGDGDSGKGVQNEKYMAERHVADILREWKPITLTVDELLSVLRQLQPRLYSISSSPLEASAFLPSTTKLSSNSSSGEGTVASNGDDHHHRTTVQLTVAVLKYTSAVGKSRVGVASTYLAERVVENLPPLATNCKVPVYLYKNPDFKLPADLKTPIIMVGPGTGVAPFRGFIQHRILLAAAATGAEKEGEVSSILGPALLFFGCRRRNQDYLYGAELENWAAQGQIELFTAFSRETNKKIYVQHRILENAERVWHLLEAGAVFYVCGDGAHMAGDVENALKSVIEQYQGQGAASAVEYFENLVKSGRYRKDVWTS
jgi:sulfite reductase (NADPH) flavoprotein alpha-component